MMKHKKLERTSSTTRRILPGTTQFSSSKRKQKSCYIQCHHFQGEENQLVLLFIVQLNGRRS